MAGFVRRRRIIPVWVALCAVIGLAPVSVSVPAKPAPEAAEGGDASIYCVLARVFLCHGMKSCPSLPRGCYLNLPDWGP